GNSRTWGHPGRPQATGPLIRPAISRESDMAPDNSCAAPPGQQRHACGGGARLSGAPPRRSILGLTEWPATALGLLIGTRFWRPIPATIRQQRGALPWRPRNPTRACRIESETLAERAIMFGRRKSSDGFEWHKYVRTTIKLRREQRRQRILEARRAAAQQAGQAGVALAAGSRAAGAAAVDGARAGLGVAALAAQGLWNALDTVSTLAWEKLVVMARPAAAALERPNIGGPVALAGAIALGIGIGRYRGGSLDREGVIA